MAWKAKALTFTDELKLQLPIDLSPAHHLLITIVEIDEKKKGNENKEEVIGWAACPLVDSDGISVIWVSHDRAQVERIADEAVEVASGRVIGRSE